MLLKPMAHNGMQMNGLVTNGPKTGTKLMKRTTFADTPYIINI